MTIPVSPAVQSNPQPRRPGSSRKLASAPPSADKGPASPAPLKATSGSRAHANEQRPSAFPTATPPSGRKAGAQPSPVVPTKQSQLIALLERKRGATLDELMQATGWQAHSVRGVLSGVLRKRLGLNVQSDLLDSIRHYRITTTA